MSDLEGVEPRSSTADERHALRKAMAYDAIGEALNRPGPGWLRRWRVRNTERYWLGALDDARRNDPSDD